mgnify:FL=1
MNRCELAYQYHKKGYNCAQSVLMSFQDVAGLSEKQCLAIASGFGAGAGTGELCGALTGAIMVLDLLTQTDTENAVEAKKRAMAQAKELQKRFSEHFDALRCAELLKKKFIPDDTTPSAKVLQLTGHCDIMIVTAVEIVEEMLQELKGEALPDHIQS